MPADQQAHILQFLTAVGGALGVLLLLGGVLLHLLRCFGGYFLVRIETALLGLLVGAAAGIVMTLWLDRPTSADRVVAGVGGAILLGLAFWFVWRGVFAVYCALACGGATGIGLTAWWGQGYWPAAVIVAAIVGIGVLVLLWLFFRAIVVLLTAAGGGFGAVYTVVLAVLIGVNRPALASPSDLLAGRWDVLALALPTALGLMAAGAWTQFRLLRRFAPQTARSSPAKARPKAKAA